jgi:DNA-binding MarR family transcriptional regulator
MSRPATARRAIDSPAERTSAGDATTELVLLTFRLNGAFLAAAEQIAAPAGLTAARWQVLGAVIGDPLPVAAIARKMGLARQSVQRIADLLVAQGYAKYSPNPAHRRAKLLAPTQAGHAAIARLSERQHSWADQVGAAVGEAELRDAVSTLQRVLAAVGDRDGSAV